ncbi:hypothetical protein IU459_08195 [Nocardia amamiensis]|uniref:Uncharacterized protein n=1 Tax=Nocardia amamiensis TaxID=404578 RepID=A0ABS0CS01_9NOCA|nr:hypothetical protein [Nocardia amamiensis]MBF6297523.1 hypothetical protein [Nocardia amamiensis]
MADPIAESGIPVENWDRWYSFPPETSQEELNSALGTRGADWYGLTSDPHIRLEVFTRGGKVIYAHLNLMDFDPTIYRAQYATPDSLVTSRMVKGGLLGQEDLCDTEIQGIG